MTDQSALREKLRLIRDSDHPASPWARNVVQCLDEIEIARKRGDPADTVQVAALGKNVAMFERRMALPLTEPAVTPLTPEEIAAIFGLGGHSDDLQ